MGNDTFDYDGAYDSDVIDEELEYELYATVFYESRTSSQPCILSPTSKDSSIHAAAQLNVPDVNTFPGESEVNVKAFFDFESSKLRVSHFQDCSSPESDQFVISSTPMSKLPHSSINARHSSVSSADSASDSDSRTADKALRDIILGVSHDDISSICDTDDSILISQRLASTSDDPELWRVCDSDRYPRSAAKSRYFNNVENSFCNRCRRRGHMSYECESSYPSCILCGEEGHDRNECDRPYCYACLAPGHTKSVCTLAKRLKHSICKRCGQGGHNSSICSELWRQYRNTTEVGRPVRETRNVRPRGCCNCGRRGHSVDDCSRQPFRSQFLGPLPRRRVLVYDKKDIYKTIRLRLAKREKRRQKRIIVESDPPGMGTYKLSVKNLRKLRHKSKCPRKNSEKFLLNLEHTVSQKLLDKVVKQELPHLKQNTSGQDLDVTVIESHRVFSKPKKQDNMMEEQYLALDPKPDYRDKFHTEACHQHDKHSSASPFLWINRHTSFIRGNFIDKNTSAVSHKWKSVLKRKTHKSEDVIEQKCLRTKDNTLFSTPNEHCISKKKNRKFKIRSIRDRKILGEVSETTLVTKSSKMSSKKQNLKSEKSPEANSVKLKSNDVSVRSLKTCWKERLSKKHTTKLGEHPINVRKQAIRNHKMQNGPASESDSWATFLSQPSETELWEDS